MARKCQRKLIATEVFIKNVSGANTSCMGDYIKLSLWKDPSYIILYVGTSDLILDRTLTTSIVNLICSMKDKKCDTSTSKIILRTDYEKLNQKSYESSTLLKKKLCKERTIYLTDNSNKIKARTTFISELSRILHWQLIKIMETLLLKMWTSNKANVEQSFVDCRRVLKSLSCNDLNKLVFGHLNVNSIRNKFEFLSEQVKSNVDVLMVSETKIDISFLVGNFLICGFSPLYRLDRGSKGGEIMLYIREY